MDAEQVKLVEDQLVELVQDEDVRDAFRTVSTLSKAPHTKNGMRDLLNAFRLLQLKAAQGADMARILIYYEDDDPSPVDVRLPRNGC